jgi:hypothetical protein
MPKGLAATHVHSHNAYFARVGRSGRYTRVTRAAAMSTGATLVALDGQAAMVADPMHGGLWIRSHRCVSLYDCPRCKSKAGVPCKGAGNWGYVCYTHVDRREKAQRARRAQCASQSAS